MQNLTLQTVLDVITDFLASEPTSQELLAYHLPDDLQARVDELVELHDEGLLSEAEREEMFNKPI